MSILVVAAAGIIALVEQSKAQPNPIIMIGAIGVFMYGMYKLMKKIDSYIYNILIQASPQNKKHC